jgi:hypothetical protein
MAYTIVTFPVAGRKPVSAAGSDAGALIASANDLNRTAVPAAEKQLTVAAYDSVLPIPYGRIKVPAMLANAILDSGWWYFWVIWARGEIDGYESTYLNDTLLPAFGGFSLHLGATPQPLDPGLYTVLARYFGEAFLDPLNGVAYSLLGTPEVNITQPPQINAVLRGLKIYDPRSVYQSLADPTTWRYSNNAALVLADFLRSTEYGAGVSVDEDSLIESANACDAEGRTLNILIDRKAKLSEWVATLQTAANVYLAPNGTSVKMIPDANRSSVATFTHAGGQILGLQNEQTDVRQNLNTVVEIVYTDPTTWKDASVQIERDGVSDGTTPWRKTSVRMPWVQSPEVALKEAYLRMNKAWLRTPTLTIQLMDEALIPEVGDPISLTYRDSGYRALLKCKVGQATPTADGWAYNLFYDDPGAYVDDRIADPTPPTDDPDPFDVPPIRNLTAIEVAAHPRFLASWDPPLNYPYTGAYPWTVQQVGASPSLVDRNNAIPPRTDFTTVDLTPGEDYTITVWNRNVFGMLSTPVSITVHLNTATYVASQYTFRAPTLVNMRRLTDWSTGEYFWVTSMGDLWNPTFPNPLDTYTNPLYTYHTPGTSTLTTEEFDTGIPFAGVVWDSTIDATDISGAGTRYIELRQLVSDSWTRHAGLTYTGDGRRVRLSSEATGSGTQRVDSLGSINVTATR